MGWAGLHRDGCTGTLISVGLIEHRPGVGTFVLGAPPDGEQEVPALAVAAQKVVDAFDGVAGEG